MVVFRKPGLSNRGKKICRGGDSILRHAVSLPGSKQAVQVSKYRQAGPTWPSNKSLCKKIFNKFTFLSGSKGKFQVEVI